MKYRFFLVSFLSFTVLFSSLIQTPVHARSVISESRQSETSATNDLLDAKIHTLDNGLKIYMTVYKNAPRIQTYIAVKAGSKNDPSDATGLAHYLEHLLFKGTTRFGTINYEKEAPLLKQIEEKFEEYRQTKDTSARKAIYSTIDSLSYEASKYAIPNEYDKMVSSIGAKGTNAYTWVEQTVYVNDIPSNQLENWLKLERERFGTAIMRLFHTELEVVYEEKNRSLDNDNRKIWHSLYKGLFEDHTYGTQTTIGTIEHLKNPSLTKVIDYFQTYYVPNNMAICLSGDFDPEEAVQLIDKYFGDMTPKAIPEFDPPAAKPLSEPKRYDIYGPDAEDMVIGFRFEGANSEEADYITLIDKILSNGSVGLIDLNLNQQQKVLGASSFTVPMKDFSAHVLSAQPKKGQTLDEVKHLLLSQLDSLKAGRFPDWLLEATLNNMKLDLINTYESNRQRASAFVQAYVWDMPWAHYASHLDRLSKISKANLVAFANKHYTDNYVILYKHTGLDTTVKKVQKPVITPVVLNRDSVSSFARDIFQSKADPIEPVFLDYQKDIDRFKIQNDIPVYYKKNTENELFNLFYILDMGTSDDKTIGLALSYLSYLGTESLTPEQLKEEFYKLGCSYLVSSSEDRVYVSLSGLSSNMKPAMNLLEDLLDSPRSNPQALKNLISDIKKGREDAKLSKETILWSAMYNFGKFGMNSPFTHILSDEELDKITSEECLEKIKSLTDYNHRVLYYGPLAKNDLRNLLKSHHRVPESLKPLPVKEDFKEQNPKKQEIFVVDYDMKQVELLLLSKGGEFNKTLVPQINLFNEYFGRGMSSVVFQELREAKALAYSVYSGYQTPKKLGRSHYVVGYIGTQYDKLPEAINGMFGLLEELPMSERLFNSAKTSLIQKLRTERITKAGILFNYENAKKLGLEEDIRKSIYTELEKLDFKDILEFHNKYVKGRNYTILVLGNKADMDMESLSKYGKESFLTLEEIFGY